MFWLAFSALTWLGLGACERVSTSDRLLTLSAFETDPESGLLNVHGSGFPPARACTLSARGKLFEAGGPAREFRQEASCRSVSEHSLIADLASFRAETAHSALFEGQLRVSFSDDEERLTLRGTLAQARIRLQGRSPNTPEQVLAEAHRARSFQRALGISEVEVQARGLTLIELTSAGLAARAGLRAGDIVTRLDGAPVELAADLSGQPGLRRTQLEFLRPGQPGTQRVELQLSALKSKTATTGSTLIFLLSGVIAWLLPASQRANDRKHRGKRASLVLLLSTVLLGGSALLLGSLDVRAIWMFPVLLHASLLTRAWRNQRLTSQELLLHFVDLGTASLAVTALGILGGSLQLQTTPEGPLDPSSFALFASPTGWLTAVLLLSRSRSEGAFVELRSEPLLEASKLAALLAFATAPLHGAGALAMLVLAALLLTLDIPALPRLAAAVLSVLALPLALTSDAFEATRLGPLCGAALCGMLLATALRTVWQRSKPGDSELDPRLSPFV